MKTKTLAIPIRCTDYSNSSQVVSLLTPDVGLLDGLAKGSHRPRSSFSGPFDLAVLYEVVYLVRQRGALALITEATVLEGYRGLRARWERYIAATHVLEFLRAVATHGGEATELFDLVACTLDRLGRLDERDRFETLLVSFDLRSLRILGLLPPICACVWCGRPWPQTNREVFLSADEGGLLCRACREKQPIVRGAKIAGEVVRLLAHLAEADIGAQGGDVERYWPRHGGLLSRTVRQMRTHLLERELTVLESAVGVRRAAAPRSVST